MGTSRKVKVQRERGRQGRALQSWWIRTTVHPEKNRRESQRLWGPWKTPDLPQGKAKP